MKTHAVLRCRVCEVLSTVMRDAHHDRGSDFFGAEVLNFLADEGGSSILGNRCRCVPPNTVSRVG